MLFCDKNVNGMDEWIVLDQSQEITCQYPFEFCIMTMTGNSFPPPICSSVIGSVDSPLLVSVPPFKKEDAGEPLVKGFGANLP